MQQMNCCFPVATIPAARAASPAIDPASGNVHLDLTVPSAGQFVARPRLAYNSHVAHATIQFGYGWAGPTKSSQNCLGAGMAYMGDTLGRFWAPIKPLGHRWTTISDTGGQVKGSVIRLVFCDTSARRARVSSGATSGSGPSRLRAVARAGSRAVPLLGYRTTTVYDAESQAVATISPVGARTTNVYDAAGRGIASIDPLGRRSTTIYDAGSRVVANIDRRGYRTTYAYDAGSRQRRIVNARGNIATTVYNAIDQTVASIDALSQRTTSVYDAAGRGVGVINALGNRATTIYNTASQAVASIDPLGNRTTQLYDAAGRGIATQNALGYRNSTIYDQASRVVAMVNPLGYRTSMAYDLASQRRRVQDANSRLTTSLYDAAGQPLATISPGAPGLGYRTSTIYDAAGQTKALWDANGGRNTFTYDAAGRRTQWIDPLGRRTTSLYDAASNQTGRIDARNYRTTYIYDAEQNLTGRKYGDGTRATFAYDAVGARTLMANETGRYTTTYDVLSQLRTVTSPPSFRITYTWDAIGQRSVMTAPTGGRFSFRYDNAGRIDRIINPEGDRTSYAYHTASRRTVKRLANGTRASFTYDAADNLTTLANMYPNGTYISKYDYKYDPTGHRYAVAEADGSRVTWLFNNLYELTGENRTVTTTFRNTFTYDPLGNRLTKTESGARTTYAYDAANQLKYGQDVSGRTTYTFDAAGNQAKEKTPAAAITTTVWNYENQPTLYKLPDATRVTMAYHPDLLRVQKDASAGTTKFIWDQENYLAEADGSNVVTTVYTTEPLKFGFLVSRRLAINSTFCGFDAVGTTRQLTSIAGGNTNTFLFDAWGEEKSHTGIGTFSMQWMGEIGSYADSHLSSIYVRHRVHRPRLGRWTTWDPTAISIALDYIYSSNNPITYIDPSGLCKCLKSELLSGATFSLNYFDRHEGFSDARDCATGARFDIASTLRDSIATLFKKRFSIQLGGRDVPTNDDLDTLGLKGWVAANNDTTSVASYLYLIAFEVCEDDGECSVFGNEYLNQGNGDEVLNALTNVTSESVKFCLPPQFCCRKPAVILFYDFPGSAVQRFTGVFDIRVGVSSGLTKSLQCPKRFRVCVKKFRQGKPPVHYAGSIFREADRNSAGPGGSPTFAECRDIARDNMAILR